MNNLIVQLKLHKGTVAYDENRNLISENQLMKLRYGVLEWKNFSKSARHLGYSKIEVIKVTDEKDNYNAIETPQEIIDSVASMLAAPKAELTPEQVEIAELKEQMAALIAGGKKPASKEKAAPKKVTEPDNTPDINEELEAARDKYLEVLGKKPNHLMKLANINKAIKEKLAE